MSERFSSNGSPASTLSRTSTKVAPYEMRPEAPNGGDTFDAYVNQYEAALNQGLEVTGEAPEYFARQRLRWTQRVLGKSTQPKSVLDFGCGVGLAIPLIQQLIGPQTIVGFDPSRESINRAQREFENDGVSFVSDANKIPKHQFDLVYCNGVFHHIKPADRARSLASVWKALKPGGWFAFWENNPWNPGTRYVMSRIPFDRDADVISPIAARRLLKSAGFETSRTDAWFLFPKSLAWLRPIEKCLYRLPFGAQYLVLARKPDSLDN